MTRRITIKIQENYCGPTLTELGQFINPDVATEVKWEGLREDYIAIKKLNPVNLVLVVGSVAAMERATATLGTSYGFPTNLQAEAKRLINTESLGLEWRRFVSSNGSSVCRGLLTKIVQEATLSGVKPKLFELIASFWVEGVNPIDASTFIDLSTL